MLASRAELASALLARLNETTASISLSAPNNFGKSTLLRQIVANHLEAATRQPSMLKLVYVDFNLRADDSTQAFYEVILRAIHHTEAQPHYRTNPALGSPTGADQLYQRLVTGQTPFEQAQAFLAALENRLEQLKLVGGRMALLLDEFDSPLTVLPGGTAFRHLRALKDHYPNQLIYLFSTNLPILTFDNQPEETERDRAEFFELFEAANMRRLGGLTHTETVRLIEDLIGVRSPAEVNYIYRASGGHPGLTHLVATLVKESPLASETDWDDLNYRLRTNLSIERECARLWHSLAAEEQVALLHWLEGIRSENALSPLGSLLERGLLSETVPDQPVIFSQAFQFYVEGQLQNITPATTATLAQPAPNISQPALSYDPRHEIVVFRKDNRRQLLTGNSASLFKYLWLRQSVPYCTKDELITAVWGQGNAYGTENLDRLVSDLRQLLGDLNKQIIRTIPRHGLKMVGVAETEIRG